MTIILQGLQTGLLITQGYGPVGAPEEPTENTPAILFIRSTKTPTMTIEKSGR